MPVEEHFKSKATPIKPDGKYAKVRVISQNPKPGEEGDVATATLPKPPKKPKAKTKPEGTE